MATPRSRTDAHVERETSIRLTSPRQGAMKNELCWRVGNMPFPLRVGPILVALQREHGATFLPAHRATSPQPYVQPHLPACQNCPQIAH